MSHLAKLVENAMDAIKKASNKTELDNIRIEYLGRKGYLTLKISAIQDLSLEERPNAGKIINEAKNEIKRALDIRKSELENIFLNTCLMEESIDVSLPGRRIENGGLHPITCTIDSIESFFVELGFNVITGPEIEDNYHNFDALNIPSYHPSRSDHDTFWFDTTRLLRTQMSSMQIRIMKNQQPPIRTISPGRVYRKDYDQTHTPMFHQIEGLMIDKSIDFTNLKWILYNFLYNFFEEDLQINFRPSYFPFTEPSAEIDIMDKNGKWIEILGCGMVHSNILHNVGIDPEVYSGFAFGIGIERLTMIRYHINDLRTFFENDLRFLEQFK